MPEESVLLGLALDNAPSGVCQETLAPTMGAPDGVLKVIGTLDFVVRVSVTTNTSFDVTHSLGAISGEVRARTLNM